MGETAGEPTAGFCGWRIRPAREKLRFDPRWVLRWLRTQICGHHSRRLFTSVQGWRLLRGSRSWTASSAPSPIFRTRRKAAGAWESRPDAIQTGRRDAEADSDGCSTSITTMTQSLLSRIDSVRKRSTLHRRSLACQITQIKRSVHFRGLTQNGLLPLPLAVV
jgi:hypothetical protein